MGPQPHSSDAESTGAGAGSGSGTGAGLPPSDPAAIEADIEHAYQRLLALNPAPPELVAELADGIRNVARTAKRHLPTGGRVLDLGSGSGEKAAILALLGYDVVAADDLGDPWHAPAAPEIIGFVEAAGGRYAHLRPSGPDDLPAGPFDMVMLHDVIEHLHDSPRTLLNQLVERLAPGGLLFVTVPNAGNLRKRIALLRGGTNLPRYRIFYWHPDPFRGHVREYVRNDLEELTAFLRLVPVELRAIHHMLAVLPRWAKRPWLVLTRIVPGWSDSWALVARKPPQWEPWIELSPSEQAEVLGHSGDGSAWRTGRPDKH